jgi:hypothetical protein
VGNSTIRARGGSDCRIDHGMRRKLYIGRRGPRSTGAFATPGVGNSTIDAAQARIVAFASLSCRCASIPALHGNRRRPWFFRPWPGLQSRAGRARGLVGPSRHSAALRSSCRRAITTSPKATAGGVVRLRLLRAPHPPVGVSQAVPSRSISAIRSRAWGSPTSSPPLGATTEAPVLVASLVALRAPIFRNARGAPAVRNLPSVVPPSFMNDLIVRLKQRKIMQWALAYLAGAWLLL